MTILVSIFNQIKSPCHSLACNVSASHMDSPSHVFFFSNLPLLLTLSFTFSSSYLFLCLILDTDLQKQNTNLLYFAQFFLSFFPSPSGSLVTSHLCRFHLILFHPPMCSPVRRRCSGDVVGWLFGTFSSSAYSLN